MQIEYLHASKFGNGGKVAAEFKKLMAAKEASAWWCRFVERAARQRVVLQTGFRA